MKRSHLNFVVDAASFIAFAAMTSSGLVLRYVLPPGGGRRELWQEGRRRGVLTLWDLDRVSWGELHFWCAMTVMVLLGVHLTLHWRFIAAMLRGREAQRLRQSLSIAALAVLFALLLLPFMWPTQTVWPEGMD